ncbi:MAG: tetratricopeptide repeat protein [Nocardioidaceae bacterium]
MTEHDLQAAAHLLDLGRADEAERLARAHLTEDPDSAPALGLLTEALTEQQRWPEAVAAGRATVAAAPDAARGLVCLSVAEGGAGNARGALDAARCAVTLAPGDWSCHYQLSLALLRRGERREALATARDVVALAPTSASAHNLLGVCLQAVGDDAGARRAYSHALRLHPHHVHAVQNLSSLDLSAGRLSRAARGATAALALAPQDERVRRRFGWVLHALVRQLNLVVAGGGTVLGVAIILAASYPVRALVGVAILAVDAWACRRMTRHLPRGLRRPGRRSLPYLGLFVRVQLLLILVATVAIVGTAFAPLAATAAVWPQAYPWLGGVVLAMIVMDLVAAVGQEVTR